jgi:signal transduction histidine kinase
LAEIAASVRDAAGQARDFAHGLNPVDVRAGGFVVAMDHLAKKVSQSFGIRCTFHSTGLIRVRDDTTATHLYRIAQEAVSNAIRHGKADHVRIELAEYKTGLAMSIVDNGSGISKAIGETVKEGMATTKERRIPTGIGLQTMHYRARVIGGTFEVMPRKGGGTVVVCRIGN